eukprot:jgi/Tetstr1/442991/TSEL_031051.t1
MGMLHDLSQVWRGDAGADKLAKVQQRLQELFHSYVVPLVFGCMGTTCLVFWHLGWYKILFLYVTSSAICIAVIAVLLLYLRRGVDDLRDSEQLTERLIRSILARRAAPTEEDPLSKCV